MVVVLGAAGQLGRRIVAALTTASVPVTAVAPDAATVRDRLAAVGVAGGAPVEVVALARGELAGLRELLSPGGLLIHADPAAGAASVAAAAALAVTQGSHHLDVLAQPGHAAALTAALDQQASRSGVVVLPALGADLVPGQALALLAAGAVSDPQELHVSYAVPGLPGVLTPGGRRAWAAARFTAGDVRVRGEMLPETLGEARRLAWFPRPIGPTHAAGVPGQLPWAVARQQPSVATARSYLALPGWRAEWLQLTGAAARWGRIRRSLTAGLERGGDTDASRLAAVRWACVAEARGADDRVARAWANGTDPLAVVAAAVVDLVLAIHSGPTVAGVQPPGALRAPETLLDRLAHEVDLRWSVVRPSGSR